MTPRPLVAVLLGTDHHPFPRLVEWATHLVRVGTCECVVQHGATVMRVPADLAATGRLTGVSMLSSVGLHELLERADAVVTHGGPGLIMEAREAGHQAIVVARDPLLGEHVDDHQQRFVARVAEAGLVIETDTQVALEAAIGAALRLGHATTSDASPRNGSSVRFGNLIDDLLLHRA